LNIPKRSNLLCAIGGNVTNPTSSPLPAIDHNSIIRVAQLAKKQELKHFIFTGSLGGTKPENPLNKYGQVLTINLEAENEVRRFFSEAGFSSTTLHPCGFIDGAPYMHFLIFDTNNHITI